MPLAASNLEANDFQNINDLIAIRCLQYTFDSRVGAIKYYYSV